MKKLLMACCMAIVFALLCCAPAKAAEHKVITGSELETMMKDGAPLVIVDQREPELYAKGHVPGAINIPYEDDTQKQKEIFKKLSTNDRIVFVCHGGPMGDEYGELLMKNGYKDVSNVKGGMRKWKGAVVK
ncbi:MAG: rhodanese-like domain-containing protein [Deltaproteobacteria bacterium]|nr:rhodanese-like domain-containing protein [Deltaproteobacteria bacterium]